MKTRLVLGITLLLLVGTFYGQNATSSGQHSHDQMQMGEKQPQPAQQNRRPTQDQSMPGMQMPDNPTSQQPQQEKTPSHENMPGMEMPQTSEPQKPSESAGPTYTLEQLQQLAIDHNPTLKQAQVEIRAAEGRKRQAGLYPNPTVGYQGEQISGGSQRGGE